MTTTTPRAAGRRRQRWLLVGLGLVFAGSAVLRIGTLDLALAQDARAAPQQATGRATGDIMAELEAALADVTAMRAELARREAEINDREQAVQIATRLVEDRLAALADAEARISNLIALSDTAAETDLDRLTRIYETMRPEQAATVFDQMPSSFAAGFMGRMAPAASAAIMAQMSPEQAYAVSVVIATRNSSAPRLGPSGTDTEN